MKPSETDNWEAELPGRPSTRGGSPVAGLPPRLRFPSIQFRSLLYEPQWSLSRDSRADSPDPPLSANGQPRNTLLVVHWSVRRFLSPPWARAGPAEVAEGSAARGVGGYPTPEPISGATGSCTSSCSPVYRFVNPFQ